MVNIGTNASTIDAVDMVKIVQFNVLYRMNEIVLLSNNQNVSIDPEWYIKLKNVITIYPENDSVLSEKKYKN